MFNAEIGFRPEMFLNQDVEAMSQMFLGYLSINDRLLKSKLPSDLAPSVRVTIIWHPCLSKSGPYISIYFP